jgi:hypothetical protein
LSFSEAIDKAIQDAEAQKAKSFANQGKFHFSSLTIHSFFVLVVNQIGDASVRTILEELFRGITMIFISLTSFSFFAYLRYTRHFLSQSFNQ